MMELLVDAPFCVKSYVQWCKCLSFVALLSDEFLIDLKQILLHFLNKREDFAKKFSRCLKEELNGIRKYHNVD